MLADLDQFLSVDPKLAAEGYLLEQLREKQTPPEVMKIMGILQFYKDKNLKVYQDCKKIKDKLTPLKQHITYERRLRERLVTGPVQDFKFMLHELPKLTPEARERTEWYIAATSSTIPSFCDFTSYWHFLKARIFALYDFPHTSEPLEADYLAEIMYSIEASVLHQ
jgi:hypothetical protein